MFEEINPGENTLNLHIIAPKFVRQYLAHIHGTVVIVTKFVEASTDTIIITILPGRCISAYLATIFKAP